jgi:hypothetical protein
LFFLDFLSFFETLATLTSGTVVSFDMFKGTGCLLRGFNFCL